MRYVVVIPAKDEQEHIQKAVESIANQSFPPQLVIVLDDGSSDNTFPIVKTLENKYDFLKIIRVHGKNNYALGGHIVQLFNKGKHFIDLIGVDYDWIVKLDADLCFEPDVVEKILERSQGSQTGIVSGTPYYMEHGIRIYEISPKWHTHGQFKIYSKDCLEKMGAIPESLGWDTADNIIAHRCGYITAAHRDINYLMSRKIGGKSSLKRGRYRHGVGCYVLDYGLLYFLLKAIHDLFKPPVFFGFYYLLKGYLSSVIHKPEKILTADESKYLRSILWLSFVERMQKKGFILFQLISTDKK